MHTIILIFMQEQKKYGFLFETEFGIVDLWKTSDRLQHEKSSPIVCAAYNTYSWSMQATPISE
jgi:hypothetical protein